MYKKLVFDFLVDPNIGKIVFALNPSGMLLPSYDFPIAAKAKSCYFIRKVPVPIPKENFRDILIFGDISAKPIDELSVLVQEVFVPLLSNPLNQTTWPQVVANDVMKHVYELKNIVYEVRGKINGQTLLPMPVGVERVHEVEQTIIESEGETVDLYLKSAIEGVIIKWATQIDEVLKEDSSCAFSREDSPTPRFEIDYWNGRLKNLECIYDQLRDPRVKKMASILELTDSAYFPCFKSIFRNIVAAVTEARDITLYLKPLIKHFDLIENTEFKDAQPLIKPLLHCVALVWANSRYYCTDTFEEYRHSLDSFFPKDVDPVPWTFHPRTVFEREIKFVRRLTLVENFFATSMEFLKLEKVEIGGWKGRPLSTKVEAVFSEFNVAFTVFGNITYDPLDPEEENFDIFMQKISDLDRKLAAIFCQAFDDCFNLESIYKEIYDEQETYYEKNGLFMIDLNFPPIAGALIIIQTADFKYEIDKYEQMVSYLNDMEDEVFNGWAVKVPAQCQKNLNKTLLLQDNETLELSLNFDDELVAILKEVRYMKIMEKQGIPPDALELFDRVETLFLWVSNLNLSIEWYNNIRQNSLPVEFELIAQEVEQIDILLKEVVENLNWNSEDVWTYVEKIRELVEDLQGRVLKAQQNVDAIHELINTWSLTPLFERKDGKKENLIYLDDRADRVSRSAGMEIHRLMDENYRLFFNIQLPEPEVEEEEVVETKRKRREGEEGEEGEEYEDEIEEAVDEEPPMEPIDDEPPPAEEEPLEAIAEVTEVSPSKAGLEVTDSKGAILAASLGAITPFGEAPPPEESEESEPQDEKTDIEKFLESLRAAGLESESDAEEDEGEGEEEELGTQGLLSLFMDEMDTSNNSLPLFLVQLALQEPDIAFLPSLQLDDPRGFYRLVDNLIKDVMKMADLVPRVARHIGQRNYKRDVENNDDLKEMITETLSRVKLTMTSDFIIEADKALLTPVEEGDYQGLLKVMGYLYKVRERTLKTDEMFEPLKEIMDMLKAYDVEFSEETYLQLQMFLLKNRVTMKEPIVYLPLLGQVGWEQHVFQAVKVKGGKHKKDFQPKREQHLGHSGLNVNIHKPTEIGNIVRDVIKHFTDQSNLYHRQNIGRPNWKESNKTLKWIDISQTGMKKYVRPNFLHHLHRKTLNILKTVKVRKLIFCARIVSYQLNVLCKFRENWLKRLGGDRKKKNQTLNLHKAFICLICIAEICFKPHKEVTCIIYGFVYHKELCFYQELPEKWNNTKKIAVTVKQNVAPLMANEANLIRKRLTYFDLRQAQYRDTFRKSPLFKFSCDSVYPTLDKTNESITAFEKEMAELQEQSSLFDVNVPDFKQLKICRKEIKMLKTLWDYVSVVKSCINEWKKTPWKKIDEMRGWDTYINLEAMIKNLLTSLRAVTELQNPAIRERHWQQLMQATKVRFVMDDSTTLSDLLALNLHEYEDEVKNIVDKSVKEMSMEKVLKELNATWSNMVFDKEVHARTNTTVIRASEELIEILEENQVALQNLMSSKYIAYFLEEVSDWQRKLSNADQVIQVWFEVQRAWMHLESIFIGSEDIRRQLPEDSKRFDSIDKQFRSLMEDMVKTLNVVQATNKPGLFEKLEELQKQLTLCEKALAEYLETKRLTYPRFYFISSADLLDILSNGNQPELVAKHLTKLYDSLAKLKFDQQGGKNTKNATAMWAKDGEFVKFNGICDCSGKVEVWLNRVTDSMRRTVRYYFGEAVITYEDNPREKWIFDYPAQVSLCGTQIWWSTEITQLNTLISLLLGDLTNEDRQKIMTICTIDVHSRDVVAKMIVAKVDNAAAFMWQSQLRHSILMLSKEYFISCFFSLSTQSCENIYKGLAQTGAWGCFDEFNRISVEVLSVVAVQVKTVLDAIKNKKIKFNFFGGMINLVPTVGLFITMNPGYAGRAELPENLKALFRPCAMVVPDFELICEIMLVAEGFQEARLLARKFITLYTLCRELLSKQDHYDWGLRAIKSVLVVAGALKRGDRGRPEDQVLMRALRDFNIPKIVTDDVPVFMGLIGDLFPALDVPRKRDPDFEKMVRQASIDLQLQPEDNFILKVVQLEELLAVRHSVFIVGNAGTGKTMVWRSLFKTYQNMKRKPIYNDLNPKAVTNNELFGIINPATREWKDGLIPVLFREQANMSGDGPKWIMLDGDIDPMWIESLNTVMDDNKVLTLASNERIALTKMMRLIFEISSLRVATPATVSRAGILYINPQDLGWNPFVTSWIDRREQQSEKANLTILFDKYVPPCLEACRTRFKKITPIAEISHIQMLCHLLDCLLTPNNVPLDCPKEWYEIYFVFACVWAFGAAMFQDQIIDYRVEFTKWWTNEFKTVKFPSQGTVFNYYIDDESKKFNSWNDLVKSFELDYDIPLQASLVSTSDTTCIRYFMNMLIEKKLPVMLVGTAGTGKSVMVTEKLLSLPDSYAVTNVPFNFYTTSEMLQRVLEKPLEKKAGRNYGPPGNKMMVYFLDDMNMPEVDTYGTVQPHTLIRQYMDYGHWYDRIKLQLKDIHNCQFVSCMNPTAGSFTVNPRLQRHFCVFAVNFPTQEPLTRIYTQILTQHLENPVLKFQPVLARVAPLLVSTALQLHQKMAQMFLPTAVKFHYIFNLRDLSNIFQTLPNPTALVRLWVHEAYRVYGDKLVNATDIDSFNKLVVEMYKKAGFEDVDESDVFEKPIIFCHFAEGIGENKYLPIKTWEHLSKLLEEGLSQYNDLVAAMNLVMFEDAMYHVCRISRILEGPRGNALLVGVGGSGKQSLSRLSAFISSLEVFQIQLRKGYSSQDMKTDLSGLYSKAGLKSIGIVAEERFLVLVNDMLASGEIPELFADDEVENIVGALRNEVKSFGMQDTKENCWRFFIDRVRRQLKIVLCFSPVGSTLRIRSRKFPAVTNCTAIDWFHEWPQEALESVSANFLQEIEDLPQELQRSVSLFMAYVHSSVNDMSKAYLENEKRYNYTTPKTFLEQINLYGKLLAEKTNDLKSRIIRLVNGLEKLKTTAAQVDDLKVILAEQEIELNEKNLAADQLIQEEKKVRVIEEDVSVKAKVCEEDLRKAEPALIAAQQALNTLNKTNLTELKSFGSPPPAVVNVTSAVLVLFSPKGRIPKDRSWKACKMMMGKVDSFLDNLIHYAKEDIQPDVYKAVQQYIVDPEFKPEKVLSKSLAAAGLCAWVINIIKFFDVYVVVEPKRRALNQANNELAAARERLKFLNTQIASLEEQLAILTAEFQEATDAKLKCQAEADATANTIDLANRLVNGLASESVRWRQSVQDYKDQLVTLPGDTLMVTAFISYVGCFTRTYRVDLLHKYWEPFIKKLVPAIPMTPDLDPMELLTDDAQIAQWNNEGLPNDRMSAENATVLTNSERWPLMIDPQLQGIKWIKNKYGSELKVIRLAHKNYLDVIEFSLSEGLTVLLEFIGETEMDFNPKFRLILQTKLANPHYKPEMQAQTTLINFTVTRDGLEEQLLAEVVKAERPDLEKLRTELTKQQNDFKITLKVLEDDLLTRLANAGEDILSDTALVINLETTKKTADEIEIKVEEAKVTSKQIDEAREQYRKAAARASLLYFILNDLNKINPIYQFSLKAFSIVFQNAIHRTVKGGTLHEHVENLLDSITYMVFMYTSRGLFECDKLIFLAQMSFQILVSSGDVNPAELDFLLRFPIMPNLTSPVDFLTNMGWGGIKSLSQMIEFKNLDRDIEGSAKRWKKFVESEYPEKEKFPQEWKNKSALQKLCMMRALRPDRMTYAIRVFVEEKLGYKYVEARSIEFAKSFEETSPSTPVFFILSPGVDPLKDVEKLGKKLGFTSEKRNFHNVSLGQGQEVVAENAMEISSQYGHWVILQNIHLVQAWLSTLEKKMEQCEEGAHPKYRLFISAEPAPAPEYHIIPQGCLESSIKITNEPPSGMMANLHKALDNFTQETLEMSTKEAEFKAILFVLCYFHAVVNERRKFGAQGWNRSYPFNVGDLTISVNVLFNYLENSTKIPWEDLRYLFGEIMYGGHITDDWDRRLCRTFLQEWLKDVLMDGDVLLAPGFPAPGNMDYVGYRTYIDDNLPTETPYLYGLHPNAEIGFLTTSSEKLFRTVFEMQPRDAGAGGGATVTREEKLPATVWLAGFFNPQSFLTAIMQSTARKNEWPLDKMCLHCDVTKKQRDEFTSAPREGAYIHGLYMEGARWDIQTGSIVESRLKELFPQMPVIFVKAITQDKQDLRNMYECPVYKTRIRGPTFVWTFNLKTKEKAAKWTMAGVAILLQITCILERLYYTVNVIKILIKF
ncbi:Dynein beta chain [Blattella germanica]|nr:Dynein beta chain [Blattella germanica]